MSFVFEEIVQNVFWWKEIVRFDIVKSIFFLYNFCHQKLIRPSLFQDHLMFICIFFHVICYWSVWYFFEICHQGDLAMAFRKTTVERLMKWSLVTWCNHQECPRKGKREIVYVYSMSVPDTASHSSVNLLFQWQKLKIETVLTLSLCLGIKTLGCDDSLHLGQNGSFR